MIRASWSQVGWMLVFVSIHAVPVYIAVAISDRRARARGKAS